MQKKSAEHQSLPQPPPAPSSPRGPLGKFANRIKCYLQQQQQLQQQQHQHQ